MRKIQRFFKKGSLSFILQIKAKQTAVKGCHHFPTRQRTATTQKQKRNFGNASEKFISKALQLTSNSTKIGETLQMWDQNLPWIKPPPFIFSSLVLASLPGNSSRVVWERKQSSEIILPSGCFESLWKFFWISTILSKFVWSTCCNCKHTLGFSPKVPKWLKESQILLINL